MRLLSSVDEALILVGESLNSLNEALILMNEALILVGESLNFLSEALILVNESNTNSSQQKYLGRGRLNDENNDTLKSLAALPLTSPIYSDQIFPKIAPTVHQLQLINNNQSILIMILKNRLP
jgi:hypothetical protein